MKILQVNNYYNYGSTGKITCDIHRYLLEHGCEAFVCYGRGEKTKDAGVEKICTELYSKINNLRSRISGIMYGGFELSTEKLKRIICREKPDVVHLQCINCFFVNIYELVDWLKRNRIKTVLTLHAEFMFTANCGHALDCEKWRTGCGDCPRYKKETRSWFVDNTRESFKRMEDAFRGFERDLVVVSVSPWLYNRASTSPILQSMRHEVIYNGVDTSVFHPQECEELLEMHGLTGRQIVFHATPCFSDDPNHLKGGWAVLDLAKRMKDLPVVFLVAGKYDLSGPVPENVVLLGQIRNQNKLAGYYSMADVTLLTSKKETFSMVCVESLCCGTPVFGFKAGAPEMIALKEFSRFSEQSDIDDLEKRLRAYLVGESYSREQIAHCAMREYSHGRMIESYLKLYREMCDT